MSDERIKERIRELLQEKNAVMLAHNYQRDEVQEIADHTGDSLGLSQLAAESAAEVIVFCGVHFMAESAAILAPDRTVLLPRREAGCPMADMIDPEGIRLLRRRYPGGTVVAYVNTSAAVKAESDICCTSANAVRVAESHPPEADPLIMVPDMNLAQYIASQVDREVVWWEGYCPIHHAYVEADVLKIRGKYPGAVFAAHPECRPEVLALADHITSTSGMYRFARETDAKEVIVGTEKGVLYRMRKENPEKTFIPLSENMICPNMKLTTLEDIKDALETMSPVITVPEEIRIRAVRALDRMLAVPRD